MTLSNGTAIPLVVPVSELGTLVGHFLKLNEFLVEQGHVESKGPNVDIVGPVTVQGLGLAVDPNDPDSKTPLLADLAGCRLALTLDSGRLKELAASLGSTALTLSAESALPS